MTRSKRTFAQIRQIESGRWQVRYTGADKKRRYAPHTFAHRIDAEAWAVAKRQEIDRGLWDADADDRPDPVTFDTYSTQWLANRHVGGRPIKARTREHYTAILRDHLNPAFGDSLINTIKPKDVRAWHEATLTDKPTMRSHAYSLLKTIMASAINDELIDANPCRIVGASQAKRVHKIKPATVEEIGRLTAEMPEKLKLMVLLAGWCSLRFGETVELRRKDIDLSQEVIRIRRAAIRTGGSFTVTTPKSEAGIRDVTIPPHLIPMIEHHLAKHVAKTPDSLLFPNETGGHLQPSTLYRHWYKAREAAGREDLRFHDLRHSGAVLAAATGATLAELMDRLGHSTPQAAMRYQHVAAGRSREIAALLSKLAESP